MRKILYTAALTVLSAISAEACAIENSWQVRDAKVCDETANTFYVGPTNERQHGGTCLTFSNTCPKIVTQQTRDDRENCSDGAYAGPSKQSEHGGTCIYLLSDDFEIYSDYTRDTGCPRGYFYAGPNKAGEHGAVCIAIFKR